MHAERIRVLTQQALRALEPPVALRALTALREELVAFERLEVARALDGGATFSDVARAVGISRQAAHRRYRDLVGVSMPDPRVAEGTPPGRIIVTSEARTAARSARCWRSASIRTGSVSGSARRSRPGRARGCGCA